MRLKLMEFATFDNIIDPGPNLGNDQPGLVIAMISGMSDGSPANHGFGDFRGGCCEAPRYDSIVTNPPYGFARQFVRIFADGQTLAAQEAAHTAAGCAGVYAERVSGVVTDRKALARAIAALQDGDTLIMTGRDDRPARSTSDWLNTLHAVTKKGAGFKPLADA